MQYAPHIIVISLSMVSIVLFIMSFFVIRVLLRANRVLRSLEEIVDVSGMEVRSFVTQVFEQILLKTELRQELIEDAVQAATTPPKKSRKPKQKKRLFRGV
ncbi:MAG: hypothetical protein H6774_01240 [Pseudomonadales bacterium]|nr:hypothetical protein [Candidatus Woesebacteria bacterium]MCB9801691.1 hypothetical protein [Pseudomonadales bacterium]